jgi:ATP-dependent exoDNAse (exonuclease V) beta subunit
MKNPIDMISDNFGCEAIIESAITNNLKISDADISVLKRNISYIIWNTLHARLDDTGLKLCAIDNKIHEVEFYYPVQHSVFSNHDYRLFSDGFIHGYIDMIFEYNGKYYLVDWKSNYIEDGYSYEKIRNNIINMHYSLQINLYIEALIRWIRRFSQDYSYDRYFGGVYYLYMRGINPLRPGDGIFFHRPDREPDFTIGEWIHSGIID